MRRLLTCFIVVGLLPGLAGCAFETFEAPVYFGGPEDVGVDGGPSDGGETEDTGGDATADAAAADAATDVSVDDGGTDVGTDMAPPVDMDPGCTDVVEPIAATQGMVCQPKTGDIPADCDPVLQTGCAAGSFCDLSLLFENGVPTGFVASCKPYDCDIRTKTEGEACSASECVPGTKCQNGTCLRFCRYEDAVGCEATQYCTMRANGAETFGYCRDTCP